MTGVARKGGTDTVHSPDGSGNHCKSESIQATNEGSGDVFVNNIGVVREGDKMKAHPEAGDCANHEPTLSTFSNNVYANNKKIGRLNDEYSGHVITSASTNVFANS